MSSSALAAARPFDDRLRPPERGPPAPDHPHNSASATCAPSSNSPSTPCSPATTASSGPDRRRQDRGRLLPHALHAMDSEDWRPVSVLYLSPIRALLNNQEARVARLAGLLGRRAFVWHGDIGPGPRRRFLGDPADVLLTTPESLEAMLMSPRVSDRRACSPACAPSSSTRSTRSPTTTAAPTSPPCSSASPPRRPRPPAHRPLRDRRQPRRDPRWLQGSSQRPVRCASTPRAAGRSPSSPRLRRQPRQRRARHRAAPPRPQAPRVRRLAPHRRGARQAPPSAAA
jgi:hypothetical protein